jgi:hypothetical protein
MTAARDRAVGQFVCASAATPAASVIASTSQARIEVWDLIAHSIGAHSVRLESGVSAPHTVELATIDAT